MLTKVQKLGLGAIEFLKSDEWEVFISDQEEQPEQNVCLAWQLASEKNLTDKALIFLGNAASEIMQNFDIEPIKPLNDLPNKLKIVEPKKITGTFELIIREIDVMTDWLTGVGMIEELMHDSETYDGEDEGHIHEWANGVFTCAESVSYLGEDGLETARKAQMIGLELISASSIDLKKIESLYPRLKAVFFDHLKFWKQNDFLDVNHLSRLQKEGILAWTIGLV